MTSDHHSPLAPLRAASDFVELQIFVAVVESGSFAGAARRLKLSPPSISRHISRLEARLKVKLVQRSTHSLAITEAGTTFYDKACGILRDLEAAEAQASGDLSEPRGWLKVSMSTAFAIHYLRPRLGEFLLQYPELAMELMLTSSRHDMLREGIDVAIVSSNDLTINAFSGFTAIFLAQVNIGAYAAPSYLAKHGTPDTPKDLLSHNCLFGRTDTINDRWPIHSDGEVKFIRVKGDLVVDNPDVILGATCAGLGIALLPEPFVADAKRRGDVVSLLEGHWAQIHNVYAIVPERNYLPKKARLFIDLAKSCFTGGG